MHPPGFDLHLFVARHHAVIGLHRGRHGELALQDFRAVGVECVNAIRRIARMRIKFVERDFRQRQMQLSRQHFVNRIKLLDPACGRIHVAHPGGIDILRKIDLKARDGFARERRRDFVHQPAVALLVRAEHFDMHFRAANTGPREHANNLRG